MNEQKILATVIQDRANYEQVVDHIDSNDFGPEAKLIYQEVGEFYSTDTHAKRVDIEILNARLVRRVPDAKKQSPVLGMVKSLPDVSGANVVKEILELKSTNSGLELAAAIAAGKNSSDIRPLLDKYAGLIESQDLENPNEEVVNVQLAEVVGRRLDDRNLIQIAPKALNDRLDGGARPGHHVLVFAPTEMGKTGFVINMLAHFARTSQRPLYIGNEDPIDDIIVRAACRIAGADKFTLKANPEKFQDALVGAGWNNIVFADLAPGTFPRINRLVRKYEPTVVILDQLSNINVIASKSESKTGSLEIAAKEARALAKRHGILVISVTQAADSATGKIVLGRGDVHNSNIGIPSQVDLMLGIGADETMESRGLREISIVKNKISGNHDHFTVRFNPTISRVD